MSRDPRSMTFDEIVREIQSLKTEMERTNSRIVELALALYSKVRQTPADDHSHKYLTFANTWTRLGQMVEASLHRTGTVTRLIEAVRREKKEAEDAPKTPKPSRKKAAPESTPSDLVELYGAEMVNHAAR